MTREEKNEFILNNTIVDISYPNPKRFTDISGTKINHLKAIRYVGKSRTGQVYYEWECDCGNRLIAQYSNVSSGSTISCGCVGSSKIIERNTRHGHSRSHLYKKYYHIRYRCYSTKKDNYADYGGRGIYVCDEWMDPENGFNNFYKWSMENGYQKGLWIDRIDNNGPYAPWNCRWVTQKVQANNTRANHLLTYGKYTYTISEWADICKLTSDAIIGRLKNDWEIGRILSTPLNQLDKSRLVIIPPEYWSRNKYRETN